MSKFLPLHSARSVVVFTMQATSTLWRGCNIVSMADDACKIAACTQCSCPNVFFKFAKHAWFGGVDVLLEVTSSMVIPFTSCTFCRHAAATEEERKKQRAEKEAAKQRMQAKDQVHSINTKLAQILPGRQFGAPFGRRRGMAKLRADQEVTARVVSDEGAAAGADAADASDAAHGATEGSSRPQTPAGADAQHGEGGATALEQDADAAAVPDAGAGVPPVPEAGGDVRAQGAAGSAAGNAAGASTSAAQAPAKLAIGMQDLLFVLKRDPIYARSAYHYRVRSEKAVRSAQETIE